MDHRRNHFTNRLYLMGKTCSASNDEPELFKNPSFVGSCIAGFTIAIGLFSFFTYLTILMQDYMGYSPLEVGLQRLIISAFPLVLGAFVGYAVGQIGSRLFASGSLLIEAVGVLTMNLMLGYHLKWTFLIPAFIFMGLGNAGINPAISTLPFSASSRKIWEWHPESIMFAGSSGIALVSLFLAW